MRAWLGTTIFGVLCLVACGPSVRGSGDDDPTGDGGGDGRPGECFPQCSTDGRSVLDCNGEVTQACDPTQACDATTFTCANACQAAENNKRSVGCDYYATDMDVQQPTYCFAAFVANTWTSPAKINVEYQGQQLNVAGFARIPTGSGGAITYAPYDPNLGLPPGEVAVLFLSGGTGAVPLCPVAPAIPSAGVAGTQIASAFHITTDVPVVAYQINPFGGGSVAVTAASLLIPTSAWTQEYIAVNVGLSGVGNPSLNIIAKEDGTAVTMTPVAAIVGGAGIPATAANTPVNITLNKGQHAQITQPAELTGSVVTSTKPIGFMAGQVCMQMPNGTPYCDHGEQMVPPVTALGHRYVGVMYRPRVPAETKTFWRVIGAVDGTNLVYSTAIPGAPATLNRGQAVTFETGTPFTVESQDKDHPFLMFTYMTSSQYVMSGYGDPDMVLSVPPEQYLKQYVFFTDPTYPETNLVLVRARANGGFSDVMLDCLGPVTGWQPVDGNYEYARVDLSTGNFQGVGACSTGRHEIKSDAPFGLWVWGWGTPNTSVFTANVSYGYPGGMNVTPINNVILKTAP